MGYSKGEYKLYLNLTLATIILFFLTHVKGNLEGDNFLEDDNNYSRGFKSGQCKYNGSIYSSGDFVKTGEPCLNCTCTKSYLICYLRVCPRIPVPPPSGCIILHKRNVCCPQVVCPEESGGISPEDLEGRSRPHEDDEENKLNDEDDQFGNFTAAIARRGGCKINGTVYAEGSALSSSTQCEYCYCLKAKQHCVKPNCILKLAGCTPVFLKNTCCPVRYNCTALRNVTIISTSSVSPLSSSVIPFSTRLPVTSLLTEATSTYPLTSMLSTHEWEKSSLSLEPLVYRTSPSGIIVLITEQTAIGDDLGTTTDQFVTTPQTIPPGQKHQHDEISITQNKYEENVSPVDTYDITEESNDYPTAIPAAKTDKFKHNEITTTFSSYGMEDKDETMTTPQYTKNDIKVDDISTKNPTTVYLSNNAETVKSYLKYTTPPDLNNRSKNTEYYNEGTTDSTIKNKNEQEDDERMTTVLKMTTVPDTGKMTTIFDERNMTPTLYDEKVTAFLDGEKVATGINAVSTDSKYGSDKESTTVNTDTKYGSGTTVISKNADEKLDEKVITVSHFNDTGVMETTVTLKNEDIDRTDESVTTNHGTATIAVWTTISGDNGDHKTTDVYTTTRGSMRNDNEDATTVFTTSHKREEGFSDEVTTDGSIIEDHISTATTVSNTEKLSYGNNFKDITTVSNTWQDSTDATKNYSVDGNEYITTTANNNDAVKATTMMNEDEIEVTTIPSDNIAEESVTLINTTNKSDGYIIEDITTATENRNDEMGEVTTTLSTEYEEDVHKELTTIPSITSVEERIMTSASNNINKIVENDASTVFNAQNDNTEHYTEGTSTRNKNTIADGSTFVTLNLEHDGAINTGSNKDGYSIDTTAAEFITLSDSSEDKATEASMISATNLITKFNSETEFHMVSTQGDDQEYSTTIRDIHSVESMTEAMTTAHNEAVEIDSTSKPMILQPGDIKNNEGHMDYTMNSGDLITDRTYSNDEITTLIASTRNDKKERNSESISTTPETITKQNHPILRGTMHDETTHDRTTILSKITDYSDEDSSTVETITQKEDLELVKSAYINRNSMFKTTPKTDFSSKSDIDIVAYTADLITEVSTNVALVTAKMEFVNQSNVNHTDKDYATSMNDESNIGVFTMNSFENSATNKSNEKIATEQPENNPTVQERSKVRITTMLPHPSEIKSGLNTTKRTGESEYVSDYDEPTLPPSLPNLKIIPFVAADAVDGPKEVFIENRQDVASITLMEGLPIYDPPSPEGQFSPPVETEGGFVPREPILDGPYFESKYTNIRDTTVNIPIHEYVEHKLPSITELPKTTKSDSCIHETITYKHGELISDPRACNMCVCLYGKVSCQEPNCPAVQQGCHRIKNLYDSESCCGKIICDMQEDLLTTTSKYFSDQQLFSSEVSNVKVNVPHISVTEYDKNIPTKSEFMTGNFEESHVVHHQHFDNFNNYQLPYSSNSKIPDYNLSTEEQLTTDEMLADLENDTIQKLQPVWKLPQRTSIQNTDIGTEKTSTENSSPASQIIPILPSEVLQKIVPHFTATRKTAATEMVNHNTLLHLLSPEFDTTTGFNKIDENLSPEYEDKNYFNHKSRPYFSEHSTEKDKSASTLMEDIFSENYYPTSSFPPYIDRESSLSKNESDNMDDGQYGNTILKFKSSSEKFLETTSKNLETISSTPSITTNKPSKHDSGDNDYESSFSLENMLSFLFDEPVKDNPTTDNISHKMTEQPVLSPKKSSTENPLIQKTTIPSRESIFEDQSTLLPYTQSTTKRYVEKISFPQQSFKNEPFETNNPPIVHNSNETHIIGINEFSTRKPIEQLNETKQSDELPESIESNKSFVTLRDWMEMQKPAPVEIPPKNNAPINPITEPFKLPVVQRPNSPQKWSISQSQKWYIPQKISTSLSKHPVFNTKTKTNDNKEDHDIAYRTNNQYLDVDTDNTSYIVSSNQNQGSNEILTDSVHPLDINRTNSIKSDIHFVTKKPYNSNRNQIRIHPYFSDSKPKFTITKIRPSTTPKTKTASGDSGVVSGILKLSGCNIFGRMYRVGKIILELSGPCLQCMCTEIGVQCSPIRC